MSQAPTQHRQSVDLARFLAASGVVVAHILASPRDWVGHLALGLFLVLTAFLSAQSAIRAGGRVKFADRARRILLPWVVWSLFYRLVDLAISEDPDRFRLVSDPLSLLAGASLHLWFLPFVAVALLAVGPFVRHVRGQGALILASGAILALSLALFWAHEHSGAREPIVQWLFALPLYALGLVFAVSAQEGRRLLPLALGLGQSLIALAVAGTQPWVITPFASALAFAAFWSLPLRHPILAHLGQVSFGIYLIHPFMALVGWKVLGDSVTTLPLILFTILSSWAATAILRRLPMMDRLT